MASYARRFVAAGVRLVGGCCGTTPEHTRQMRVAATAPAAGGRAGATRATVSAAGGAARPCTPVPRAEKSRLANALARGQFVLAVELDPPRGHATQEFVELAASCGSAASTRCSSPIARPAGPAWRRSPPALLLERQAGIETVLQFRCRDRRLAGMQAELLGAHALGLRNLLLVTGEPTQSGRLSRRDACSSRSTRLASPTP